MNRFTEVWIKSHNHNTMETRNVAYYSSKDGDTDTDLHKIMKDLRANQYEVESVEYIKKGGIDVFEITVI